jgi:hypothetical protein
MKNMERLRLLPILMAVGAIAMVCVPMAAQTESVVTPTAPKVKQITPVSRPVPFSLDPVQNREPITFRTVDQMTAKDRDLVADAESSVSERTGFMGIEFNGGKWNYEQVVCPALPNHILLRFTRNDGTGDASIFSASIPRNGDGRVRIIPIRLRGYSLFSPAPINALTISAFNHIRAEEHSDALPEWLGTGLCYAALAGGHPTAALPGKANEDQKFPLAMPALLKIPSRGDVTVSFAEASAVPRPMEWTMIFDRKGKLLKATHRPADLIPSKEFHPAPIVVKGNATPPVHGTADAVGGKG